MCCWCARVYWTVLHNLFARFLGGIAEHSCCRCCAVYQRQASDSDVDMDVDKSDTDDDPQQQHQSDYVTSDDAEVNYAEIEEHNIETEAYYFTVDRPTAERMLSGREDGACLVRPFKATDICIKYIAATIRHRTQETPRADIWLSTRDRSVLCREPTPLYQQEPEPMRPSDAHQLCLDRDNLYWIEVHVQIIGSLLIDQSPGQPHTGAHIIGERGTRLQAGVLVKRG